MVQTAVEMTTLVDAEIESISDPIVRSTLRARAVTPTPHHREWFYGGPVDKHLCWTVLEDEASDTGIVYCETGFGPTRPWGLVNLSDHLIGADYGWFSGLEDAFYESFASGPLRIWNLLTEDEAGNLHVIERELTDDEAYEKGKKLGCRFWVEPRTKPWWSSWHGKSAQTKD